MQKNWYRLFAASLLSGSLVAGCSTIDGDFDDFEAVGSTHAPLVSAPDGQRIPGEYIVVFKDQAAASSVSAAMNRVATASASNRVAHTYSVIPGFAARLDAHTLDALRRDPNVAYIEEDAVVSISTIFDSPADGIDRTDQRQGRDGKYNDHGRSGAGVHLYIVDTGIRTTHNEFTGRIGNGFTAINDGRGVEDCQGHGTHVASTAGGTQFGMAKQSILHPVRVLNCQGSGTNAGVIAGVDFVRNNCPSQNGPCVANMSLGGGASGALDSAVANAVNSGVTFVVAAGNENQNACNVSPAREPKAITVAAMDDNDKRASFSNFGNCVDLFAPGVTILGAWINSNTSTNTISGTSMASPHVAGAAAQFLSSNPNATPAQVEEAILAAANLNCVTDAKSANIMLHNNFGAGNFDCNGGPGPGDSCQNRCGNFDSSKSCQCDSQCEQFGDCCPDKAQFCSNPNSCVGNCGGQAPGGCFCDSSCVFFGDCCPDKQQACG